MIFIQNFFDLEEFRLFLLEEYQPENNNQIFYKLRDYFIQRKGNEKDINNYHTFFLFNFFLTFEGL